MAREDSEQRSISRFLSSPRKAAIGASKQAPVLPRSGFTLFELVVVTGIILVAAGLLLAAVVKVRESSLEAQCSNNLRHLEEV